MSHRWVQHLWKLGVITTVVMAGCANSPDRLPSLSRKFYYNLTSPEDQRAFLKTKEAERQGYLEHKGLWKKWAALPQAERDAVINDEIKVGFHEFSAFMVWGPPADTQGEEPKFHTFIRCTSGPKTGRYVPSNLDCDGTSSEKKITVDHGVIVEIKFLN